MSTDDKKFGNSDSRMGLMKAHVQHVAESILNDHDGEAHFQSYLRLSKHVWNYSIRNKILMAYQAHDSKMVASKGAFDKIAREQSHEPKTFRSAKKSWTQAIQLRQGCSAVWILGACSYSKQVEKKDGTTEDKSGVYFKSVPVFRCEDVIYCDTGENFEVPDFVVPVNHPGLYDALMAFAKSEGITVEDRNLQDARGASSKYNPVIYLQKGDSEDLRIPVKVHELAHQLLHRVHNKIGEASDVVQLREAEAEATCAVVLRYLGHDIAPSAAYLRNWKVTPEQVIKSMDRISKAATMIVDFVDEHLGAKGEAKGEALDEEDRGEEMLLAA